MQTLQQFQIPNRNFVRDEVIVPVYYSTLSPQENLRAMHGEGLAKLLTYGEPVKTTLEVREFIRNHNGVPDQPCLIFTDNFIGNTTGTVLRIPHIADNTNMLSCLYVAACGMKDTIELAQYIVDHYTNIHSSSNTWSNNGTNISRLTTPQFIELFRNLCTHLRDTLNLEDSFNNVISSTSAVGLVNNFLSYFAALGPSHKHVMSNKIDTSFLPSIDFNKQAVYIRQSLPDNTGIFNTYDLNNLHIKITYSDDPEVCYWATVNSEIVKFKEYKFVEVLSELPSKEMPSEVSISLDSPQKLENIISEAMELKASQETDNTSSFELASPSLNNQVSIYPISDALHKLLNKTYMVKSINYMLDWVKHCHLTGRVYNVSGMKTDQKYEKILGELLQGGIYTHQIMFKHNIAGAQVFDGINECIVSNSAWQTDLISSSTDTTSSRLIPIAVHKEGVCLINTNGYVPTDTTKLLKLDKEYQALKKLEFDFMTRMLSEHILIVKDETSEVSSNTMYSLLFEISTIGLVLIRALINSPQSKIDAILNTDTIMLDIYNRIKNLNTYDMITKEPRDTIRLAQFLLEYATSSTDLLGERSPTAIVTRAGYSADNYMVNAHCNYFKFGTKI